MSNQAEFPPSSGSGYILDRSYVAACRLNVQHFLWRECIGFTVYPGINLPPHSAIADVACGTGLWLRDAAKQYPEAQLHGFDIDLSQAPHSAWLPPNVKLSKWNIFDDVPHEMEGKFDLVHVRLLVLVLAGIDPKPVAKKFYRLLKPGGWLQWDELDCANMSVAKADPNIDAPALEELCKLMYSEGRHNWTRQIPENLRAIGFENVYLEDHGDDSSLSRALNDQHMLTMEEIGTRLFGLGNNEEAGKVFKLIKDGYAESVNGAAIFLPRIVCVGKRPD